MENTKDTIVRELAERKQKNGDLTKRDIDEVIEKYITIPDDKFLNEFDVFNVLARSGWTLTNF